MVEIVIVMTILAVLAAASIPSFRGLQRERAAREPLVALIDMAREARLRAMKTKRPYQIAFTAQGMTGTRYFDPYLTQTTLQEFILQSTPAEELTAPDAKEDDESDAAAIEMPLKSAMIGDTAMADPDSAAAESLPAAPPEPEWIAHVSWPEGAKVAVQLWSKINQQEADYLDGERVAQWVFQPTGIVELSVITITPEGGGMLQLQFGGLTADPVRERTTF